MTFLRSLLFSFLKSTIFKFLIAMLIVGYLIYSNRLSLNSLTQVKTHWHWLLLAFLLTLPPFLIVSLRFLIILSSQGIRVPYFLALRWTMIGSFFDLSMPSSNGGDIFKAAYVASYAGSGNRLNAIMSVFFDRVIGLMGLFILACFASIIGWSNLNELGTKNELIFFTFLLGFGPLIFFRVLGANRIYHSRRLNNFLSPTKIGQRILQLIGSFNLLRRSSLLLLISIALSVINHLFWCLSLMAICNSLGEEVTLLKSLIVFPIAIFFGIFGLAGGFGVGTLAFQFILEKTLFISNGAMIGLLFQIMGLFSRLMGAPFYMFYKANKVRGLHSIVDTHPKN